jgi:hypothetical protein
MASYNPPLTALDKEEVRRYAGLRPAADFPEQYLDEACGEGLLYARPRAVWKIYAYAAATREIAGQPPLRLSGDIIAAHLASATEVAVLAVTIGDELEHAVSNYFAAGDYTRGLLLDAAGTAAVETAADAVDALIAAQAARRGFTALPRFSPGYGDWPLTDQPAIVSLAGGGIDLTVTASAMLVPRKSITAVIGLAPQRLQPELPVCREEACVTCPQPNCLARKETQP